MSSVDIATISGYNIFIIAAIQVRTHGTCELYLATIFPAVVGVVLKMKMIMMETKETLNQEFSEYKKIHIMNSWLNYKE